MAFALGNFNVDEILQAVAQASDGTIKYTLDQLSSASIEISSESTDITDKRGNIVRTIYRTKEGTFTATNAFLHPQVMNAQSGSDVEYASNANPLTFPKVVLAKAGATVQLDDGTEDTTLNSVFVEDSERVIGVYKDGGNSEPLTVASDQTPGVGTYTISNGLITLPPAADGQPVNYLIKYDRIVKSGMKLVNNADDFASNVQMTLYCAIVDPCSDKLRSAYVYLPSFQPSPETTISLDAEDQELDFTGRIAVDYCGTERLLYAIYFPDEDAVTTAISGQSGTTGA